MSKITYTLEVVTQKVGIEEKDILNYIENNIVTPYRNDDLLFDDEDIARLILICELREHCDPNEESLQVILHLIDQIHYLQNRK
ncbi:chaperone modulator CbpM [Bacteriovoracaceae bacterium]|nr:chaperone modulator CbpM [Bacteriovoracaceae bacterium]